MTSETSSETSRVDRIVHGLLGAIAGLGLGLYVATQLTGVHGFVHLVVTLLLSAGAAALAFRYGPEFWKALFESVEIG
jgi:hypothetical protein